jgi:hypothetical protein
MSGSGINIPDPQHCVQEWFTQEHQQTADMSNPTNPPSHWECPPHDSSYRYVPRTSVHKLLEESRSLSEELKPIFDKWLGGGGADSEDTAGESNR